MAGLTIAKPRKLFGITKDELCLGMGHGLETRPTQLRKSNSSCTWFLLVLEAMNCFLCPDRLFFRSKGVRRIGKLNLFLPFGKLRQIDRGFFDG
jgi:hypothetical protein